MGAGLVAVSVFGLGLVASYFAPFIKGFYIVADQLPVFFLGLAALSGLVFLIWRFKTAPKIGLKDAAKQVEIQSDYFDQENEHRSELISAASFLEGDELLIDGDFQSAHLDLWNRRLGAYYVELRPKLQSVFVFCLVVVAALALFELYEYRHQSLPSSVRAWYLKSFDEKLDIPNAEWVTKTGSLSAVESSKIRFESPDTGILQPYLFVQEGTKPWVFKACQEYCEWTVTDNGRYAVGTLLYRSAKFPMQSIPDEAPRAVVFVREGEDLIPSATVQVENKDRLRIHLLANDDIFIKRVKLMHAFEDSEEMMWEQEVSDTNFKKDQFLDLTQWKGGRHDVFLRVYDHHQYIDSSPLTILYADEEFMRKKRIEDLRALIGEWVHVLADLLESEQDRAVHPQLGQRLEAIQYPSDMEEGLMQVYVAELKLLSEKIDLEIVDNKRIDLLPPIIEEVEKQILYGLSLVFQERAGDVQATRERLNDTQKDLTQLLKELREGKKELSNELMQETFEELMTQLEELQEKIRNLPQGPQDELVNREALEEQASQSQELEDRIAEIQEMIAEGQGEQALKELESLVNQLGILSKEIERSLEQWEENIQEGSMQASENFQKKLNEIREKQEQLVEKTDELKQRKEKLEKESQESWQPIPEEQQQALEDQIQNAESEQAQLAEEFQQLVTDYDAQMQGTDWEQVFRSQEAKDLESQVLQKMEDAQESLRQERVFDAKSEQQEAVELLRQAQQNQQQMRQQVRQQAQQSLSSKERNVREKVEIIESEGKGEKERRRKIMNSLRQKVDDRFQSSHERYFEDLLQR